MTLPPLAVASFALRLLTITDGTELPGGFNANLENLEIVGFPNVVMRGLWIQSRLMRPEGRNVAWNARVGWAAASPSTVRAARGHVPPVLRGVEGGTLVSIIPKTTLHLDAREDATQHVPLKTRIDARAFATAALVVRVHALTGFADNAVAFLRVYNESVERDGDGGSFFVEGPLATATITISTTPPTLLVANAVGLASHLRVVLEWDQGDRESALGQTVTIAVDLAGRTHAPGIVIPATGRLYRPPRLEPLAGIRKVTPLSDPYGGAGFHVVSDDHEGDDFLPRPEQIAAVEVPRAGGTLVHLVPETTFVFDGRANSTQRVLLADRIDVRDYESLVLALRVHDLSGWAASAKASLALRNASVDPQDPGVRLAEATDLAEVSVQAGTSTPHLAIVGTGSLDGVASHVQLALSWAQGAGTASNQVLTFSAELLGRFHRSAFKPTDIEGCILWLRSDMLITVSGTDVSNWEDGSGAGNHAAQVTSSERPRYTAAGWSNGLPTVDFDRAGSHWMHIAAGVDGSTSYTGFAAIDQRNPSTDTQMLLSTFGASSDFAPMVLVTRTADDVGIQNGGSFVDIASAVSGEQYLTWVLDADAARVQVYRDGSDLGNASYSGTGMQWGSDSALGAYRTGGADYVDAEVAEVILYNRVLTSEERDRVHAYLSARYEA